MTRTLNLKKDTLTVLSEIELTEVVGAADYTGAICDLTDGCFTHTTSLDCEPTDICPQTLDGCG
jgi:hypothetical protein